MMKSMTKKRLNAIAQVFLDGGCVPVEGERESTRFRHSSGVMFSVGRTIILGAHSGEMHYRRSISRLPDDSAVKAAQEVYDRTIESTQKQLKISADFAHRCVDYLNKRLKRKSASAFIDRDSRVYIRFFGMEMFDLRIRTYDYGDSGTICLQHGNGRIVDLDSRIADFSDVHPADVLEFIRQNYEMAEVKSMISGCMHQLYFEEQHAVSLLYTLLIHGIRKYKTSICELRESSDNQIAELLCAAPPRTITLVEADLRKPYVPIPVREKVAADEV